MAVTHWTRNGEDNRIRDNGTFSITLVIVDYMEAVYNHTLTVTENYPGTYQFFVKDPFIVGEDSFLSRSANVQGINYASYIQYLVMIIIATKTLLINFAHSDLCSGDSLCNKNVSCEEGFQYEEMQEMCMGTNYLGSSQKLVCTSLVHTSQEN